MIIPISNRLIYRDLRNLDINDLFEYLSLPNVVEMVGMRLHNSLEFTEKYIKHELKKMETVGIILKESNKLIGTMSLRKQSNDFDLDIRQISCVINPKFWGKGYAPEAIKELIKHAFEIEHVHKLLGGHYSFNDQSASLNKKLGFVYEGTQREVFLYKNKLVDAIEYSMLFKDYENSLKNLKTNSKVTRQ